MPYPGQNPKPMQVTAVELERQPHAVLDLPSRYKKALKIERLLQLSGHSSPIKILEIGTGSGGIAHYFAHHPTLNCDVTAVDIVDQRLVKDGYQFVLVQDTRLPFQASSFDVVLSNHVIEHVGNTQAQALHLMEMNRVLNSTGIGYLAVPNRWMLIEPHYKLAFLSYLPIAWRSSYVRLMNRGHFYDCNPLTTNGLETLLKLTGFTYSNLSTAAIQVTLDIEGRKGVISKLITHVPTVMLRSLSNLNPTLIYRISKTSHQTLSSSGRDTPIDTLAVV